MNLPRGTANVDVLAEEPITSRSENCVIGSDETGERWAIAEMLRIKAGLLQAAGRAAADEIERQRRCASPNIVEVRADPQPLQRPKYGRANREVNREFC